MASKKKKDTDLLRTIRDRLKQAQDAEADNRAMSIEDMKFENGDQWEGDQKRDREKAGRPCLTINKVAATVKMIIGDMRQNKLSIKVRPVDSDSDPEVADILTGLIRNIENISNAEDAYDYASECAIRGGWGYFRILTDYSSDDSFGQDILIKRIVNQFSVYYDSAAVEPDKSDARWCIVTQPMSKEEFESTYPGKSTSNQLDLAEGESDASWFAEETVTIAEYWVVEPETKRLLLMQDGRTVDADELGEALPMVEASGMIVRERQTTCNKVKFYKVSGGEILEGPKEWAGKWIPIIPVLGEEVWIEGKVVLRSAIRWAKDPNRLYNWARSNAVETLALAPKQPYIGTPAMFENHEDQWDEANRTPQSRLVANFENGMLPQRAQASIPDTGAIQEAMQASDDIKSTTGYFDASMGAEGNETSGRAIIARQRQSNTSTFVFTDNLRRALNYAGRILVDLIPKVYDTERVVRLLNQDGSEGWAKINEVDPITGAKANDVSVGKYDVVVETGPAYSTKRLEAADGMVQVVSSAPQFAPILVPEIVKNLDWPGAQEIAEKMQAMVQGPQEQGPDPRMQMEMAKGEQEIVGKQLDNQKKQVEMQMAGRDDDERTYEIAQQAISDFLKQMGVQ